MSIREEQAYVIKNENGLYVNIQETNQGYRHTLYSGIPKDRKGCFKYYTNEDTVKEYLMMLGEGFYSEYIKITDIPSGSRINVHGLI